jgi:ABC-type glutathione transport system ATPase component
MREPLLQLRLSVGYDGKPDVLRNVSFELGQGEMLGLVGRSGEGKSTIALAILGLLGLKGGRPEGQIFFRGENLLQLKGNRMRELRGKAIGLVPQSPLSALNPNLRLGAQLGEAWRAHEPGKPDWKPLLESVSLPAEEAFLCQYPRSLSVGMAQRFMIALAILHKPELLLADEPTSALDTITQLVRPSEPRARHCDALYFARPCVGRLALPSGRDSFVRRDCRMRFRRKSVPQPGPRIHPQTDRGHSTAGGSG